MTNSSNHFDPSAKIHDSVQMGIGNYFGPGCVIEAGVVIGNHNRFEGLCSIGTKPEHKAYWYHKELPGVVIGDRNVVREFVTINKGTKQATRMGNDCIMLRGSHLSHDSVLENDVTVSCNVLIGGESYVFRQANLGLACVLHQRSCVGRGVLLGMGATIPKKKFLTPFTIYIGVAQELGPNQKLITELNLGHDEINMEKHKYSLKFREINRD